MSGEAEFSGKTAFVTGGGRGIGLVLARSFADAGANVVLADVNVDNATSAAEAIGVGRAMAVPCDVSSRSSVAAAIKACEDRFGRLDILVNNAGRHTREFNSPVTEVDEARWQAMLGTNVMGVVNCCTVAAEALRRCGGGSIINVSSVSGYDVRTAYGVTKLAVRGLTTALAEELAPSNIRVNGIAPGLIDTQIIMDELEDQTTDYMINQLQLVKRLGKPQDLVGLVHFLCSEKASFITGETVLVGGGYARHP